MRPQPSANMTFPCPASTQHEIRKSFDDLATRLKAACAGRSVVFLQNDGNFGDALIRYGTVRFFEDIGVRPKEYDMAYRAAKIKVLLHGALARARDDTVFIYSGSGAWANACPLGWKNVSRQVRINPRLIVLPSTFEAHAPPETVMAFARDQDESLARAPHTTFCHDMALYLATIDRERVLPDRTAPQHGLGLMFRQDNEARDHGLADLPGNHDISAAGNHRDDPRNLLRYIDNYEAVLTDRLHVAIGATILGKQIYLLPGNYFKIKSIYRSSIMPFFENCTMISDEEARDVIATLSNI